MRHRKPATRDALIKSCSQSIRPISSAATGGTALRGGAYAAPAATWAGRVAPLARPSAGLRVTVSPTPPVRPADSPAPAPLAALKNHLSASRSASSRFPACLSRSPMKSCATVIDAPARFALQNRRNAKTHCCTLYFVAWLPDVVTKASFQFGNETGTALCFAARSESPESPVRLCTGTTFPPKALPGKRVVLTHSPSTHAVSQSATPKIPVPHSYATG